MEIKSINTEVEYIKAVARLKEIFHAIPGSKEGAEADRLSELIVQYEDCYSAEFVTY